MKAQKIALGKEKQKEVTKVHDIRLAVLGKSLVGKSALTYRFINDKFPKDHDTTIEDQYRIDINIESYNCCLGN
jgi:GTPase SAR1 family protein